MRGVPAPSRCLPFAAVCPARSRIINGTMKRGIPRLRVIHRIMKRGNPHDPRLREVVDPLDTKRTHAGRIRRTP